MYYLCSENKGADQLHGYWSEAVFSHMQKAGFLATRIKRVSGDYLRITQCFSIKFSIIGTHLYCLAEAILFGTQNMVLWERQF